MDYNPEYVSMAVMHDPARAADIFKKSPVFRMCLNRVLRNLSNFMEGRLTDQSLAELAEAGVKTTGQAYKLWANATKVEGEVKGGLLFDKNSTVFEPVPLPSFAARTPPDELPDIGRMIRVARDHQRGFASYPDGIVRLEDPFSAGQLLMDMDFGYGCGEETIGRLLRVAELRKEESLKVLRGFCDWVNHDIPKRRYGLDKADQHLLSMMHFVYKRFLVPLGVEDFMVWNPPENALRHGANVCRGTSFELLGVENLDDRIANIEAGYVITLEHKNELKDHEVKVYKVGDRQDIALVYLGPRYAEKCPIEIARVALRVGFGGKYGIKKDNPPFVSLKGEADELTSQDLFVNDMYPFLWELLESFVSCNPYEPESAWKEKSIPIAVEDEQLVRLLDSQHNVPFDMKLRMAENWAAVLAEQYVKKDIPPRESAAQLYEILMGEARDARRHQDAVLGHPVKYLHFLVNLGSNEVIRELHPLLMKRHEQSANFPAQAVMRGKIKRMKGSYRVEDKIDEEIMMGVIDKIEETAKKMENLRRVFWTGGDVYLIQYDEARKRAAEAIGRGKIEDYRGTEPRSPPVPGSVMKVSRYKTRLHDKCKQISPGVVSYKIFV